MKLYLREYGERQSGGSTLILLHGLLGSSANWHGIAKRLAVNRHVLVPDLRNHGRSPHGDEMSYPDMSRDISKLITEQGLGPVDLAGHSMGGKTAMWLALSDPDRIRRLLVVDIAPVAYTHTFAGILEAMRSVDLNRLTDRGQADSSLAAYLPDRGLRQYLLQNLVLVDRRWSWRVNLDALERGMTSLLGFPSVQRNEQFPGPTLFLYGGASDYVQPRHALVINTLFPYARMRVVPGAGHWLYAEQPDAFVAAVEFFLGKA